MHMFHSRIPPPLHKSAYCFYNIFGKTGFAGPMWVECVGGKTLAGINEEARKAREFIESLM